MNIFLSVVIPAYNESKNLQNGVLEEVNKYLSRQNYSWEVLVIDDGSSDTTLKDAREFADIHDKFRVIARPHKGKAGTVTYGVLKARGDIVLFSDMDQATPINQIERFLPKFSEGYGIVIGSRSGREGAPLVRRIMAVGFTVLRTLILRLPYKDTQCGFKAFKKDAAVEIFNRLKVFGEGRKEKKAAVTAGFDLEVLYIARKLSIKVAEVPVLWHHKGTIRVNPVRDSWEGLKDLVKVRINASMGKYRI